MGETDTWLSLIPGVKGLEQSLMDSLPNSFLFNKPVTDIHQVSVGLLVFVLLIFAAIRFRSALKNRENGGVIPEGRFNLQSIFEVVIDYALGVMTGIMGEKAARHFLPFIGTFAFFIMFSNLFSPTKCVISCIASPQQ